MKVPPDKSDPDRLALDPTMMTEIGQKQTSVQADRGAGCNRPRCLKDPANTQSGNIGARV